MSEPNGPGNEPITMEVLTRDLDNWKTDAWLVELSEPIRPVLKSYKEVGDGMIDIDRVAMPHVKHVVVSKTDLGEFGHEVMVFPAFASGEYRGIGDGKEQIAGPTWGTHLDVLDDLATKYVNVECDIEGERAQHTRVVL